MKCTDKTITWSRRHCVRDRLASPADHPLPMPWFECNEGRRGVAKTNEAHEPKQKHKNEIDHRNLPDPPSNRIWGHSSDLWQDLDALIRFYMTTTSPLHTPHTASTPFLRHKRAGGGGGGGGGDRVNPSRKITLPLSPPPAAPSGPCCPPPAAPSA